MLGMAYLKDGDVEELFVVLSVGCPRSHGFG
jgi:hypothetical protein